MFSLDQPSPTEIHRHACASRCGTRILPSNAIYCVQEKEEKRRKERDRLEVLCMCDFITCQLRTRTRERERERKSEKISSRLDQALTPSVCRLLVKMRMHMYAGRNCRFCKKYLVLLATRQYDGESGSCGSRERI